VVGHVLAQGPAGVHIEHLDSPAYAQHGSAMLCGCVQDGQFMGVTARLHLAEARVLVRCVERRVNICSTTQNESVQPADHLGSSVPGDEHRYAAGRRYLTTVTGEVDVDV
ncbi:uncharacterized protein METZ01_LOCUS278657, partial [marine metagenome]